MKLKPSTVVSYLGNLKTKDEIKGDPLLFFIDIIYTKFGGTWTKKGKATK